MEAASDVVRFSLAGLFSLVAAVRFLAPGFVRRLYGQADYPVASIRAIAVLLALSAAFLLIPHTHIWGIALAAGTMFLSIVTMLYRERYGLAVLGIFILIALPVAIMAAPLS